MLCHKIRGLRIKGLFLLLLLPVLVFVCVVVESNHWFQSGMKLCLGDCFILISGRNFLLFLVLTVFMATYIFKDENQQILLTQVSKRRIYIQNFLLMLAITFLILLYVYFCTIFIGLFVASSFLNWHETASVYFVTTEQTNAAVSFAEILFWTFSYNFLSTVLLNVIYIVIFFLTRKPLCGCLILSGVLTIGNRFVRLFSDYHMFEPDNQTPIYMLGFVVCSILLFFCGYVKAERKDYLE